MMAFASRSSAWPPNIIERRQIRDTSSPLLPIRSYNTLINLLGGDDIKAGARKVDVDLADARMDGSDDELFRVGRQKRSRTGSLPVSSGVTITSAPAFKPDGSASRGIAGAWGCDRSATSRASDALISVGRPWPIAATRSNQLRSGASGSLASASGPP